MALGERFRSGGARGIARFLGDHQHCDAGFDVRRDSTVGTGRLSITCKGCRQAITYKAAEAGELAAGPPLPDGGPTSLAGPELPEPPATESFKPVSARAPSRSTDRNLTRLIPMILIGGLIIAGLVLIAVGVLRTGDESQSRLPTTPQEANAPADTPAPAAPPPEQAAPPPEPAPQVELSRRDFAGRFAIGVPAGWEAVPGSDTIAIASPGGEAEIRVFSEPGEAPTVQLARSARDFLADARAGAEVGKPKPLRLGQQPALSITATYEGGEEIAVVLSGGGYAFVVLRRVDSDASAAVAAEADQALASFRAKS
jgi:hypothetical protein